MGCVLLRRTKRACISSRTSTWIAALEMPASRATRPRRAPASYGDRNIARLTACGCGFAATCTHNLASRTRRSRDRSRRSSAASRRPCPECPRASRCRSRRARPPCAVTAAMLRRCAGIDDHAPVYRRARRSRRTRRQAASTMPRNPPSPTSTLLPRRARTTAACA